MATQFTDMKSSLIFFDVAMFLLSSLVIGSSIMLISSLVLELWQFLFINDWREIRKPKIPTSDFCPISGDSDKLRLPNLARMFVIKCYWKLANSRVTAFTVFELVNENQQWEGELPPAPRIGLIRKSLQKFSKVPQKTPLQSFFFKNIYFAFRFV